MRAEVRWYAEYEQFQPLVSTSAREAYGERASQGAHCRGHLQGKCYNLPADGEPLAVLRGARRSCRRPSKVCRNVLLLRRRWLSTIASSRWISIAINFNTPS